MGERVSKMVIRPFIIRGKNSAGQDDFAKGKNDQIKEQVCA